MKISVNLPLCQAYGLCVMEAPNYFEIDEDADKVRLLADSAIDSSDIAALEAAARACPVFAIKLERETTDVQAP